SALVARLDRHRDAARAQQPRRRDQDLRLEHEVLAGHVVERGHACRVEALPALAVGDLVAGAPGDAPVAEFVGQAAVDRLLRTLARGRADHDVARVAVGRLDHARDVAGLVLAVAVHGQYRARALAQRLAEAVAQRRTLAHAPRMPQQRDRQVRELGDGVVLGTVV